MTIYTADTREALENTVYPRKHVIHNEAEFIAAMRNDCVFAELIDNKRSKDNFIGCDCVILDLDNSHSAEPNDWKSVDDVAEAFPDVEFYFVQSRNHMKTKKKINKKTGEVTFQEPRGKWHLAFPTKNKVIGYGNALRIMMNAVGLFPFFDASAARPVQQMFGVANPVGGYVEGSLCIDQFFDQLGEEELNRRITDNYRAFRKSIKEGDFGENDGNGTMIKLFEDYLGISRETEHTTAEADGIAIPSDLSWLESHEQKKAVYWVKGWARDNDIKLRGSYKIDTVEHPQAIVFPVSCPWESLHTEDGGDKESVIIIEHSGMLGYRCRHNHCLGRSWKDYRAKVENQKEENRKKDRDEDQTAPNDKKTGINLTRLSEVEEQEPDWLIDGYLARGEINILGGDGGSGKTFVWVAIAAAVSNGEQPAFITGCPFGSDRRNKA